MLDSIKSHVFVFKVRIYYDRGIYVEGRAVRFVVDPAGPIKGLVDFVLITHGHSDHVSLHAYRYPAVATKETFAAMAVRYGRPHPRRIVVSPGDVLELNEVQIAAFDAGHILGSVMYLVEVEGLQVLFTGDFNTSGSILTDGAEPVERPDVLVMEATYGDPAYVFPNRAEIYDRLIEAVEKYAPDGGVAISAYPLGKAQEVAKLFGRRVGAHRTVAKYNEALGIQTGKSGEIVIVPNLRAAPSGYHRIEVSGWYVDPRLEAEARARGVHGLPLSDHSDFPSLIDFVAKTSPRLVYTVYGYSERLAMYLRRKGFKAYTIPGAYGLTRYF